MKVVWPASRCLAGGRRLASGSPDGLVRVWDLATGSTLWQGQEPHGARRRGRGRLTRWPLAGLGVG